MVNAAPNKPGSWPRGTAGSAGFGSAALITPKRAPIVSTGMCRSWTSAVVRIRATNGLGMRRLMYGQPTMMPSASTATASAQGLSVPSRAPNACHFATKSAGAAPMRRPRKSFTWLEKMINAIPAVKPIVTG